MVSGGVGAVMVAVLHEKDEGSVLLIVDKFGKGVITSSS